jgi:hypothetical protein
VLTFLTSFISCDELKNEGARLTFLTLLLLLFIIIIIIIMYIIFIFCLFWSKMLLVSFGLYSKLPIIRGRIIRFAA